MEYVLSCMNFDGGFGCRPGSESHSGQVTANNIGVIFVNFGRAGAGAPLRSIQEVGTRVFLKGRTRVLAPIYTE